MFVELRRKNEMEEVRNTEKMRIIDLRLDIGTDIGKIYFSFDEFEKHFLVV